MSSSKISPELSDLVVYCCSVPYPGFDVASQRSASEMSSFSENEALKLIKDSGETHGETHKTFHIYKNTVNVV